jgi:hypothetical protein
MSRIEVQKGTERGKRVADFSHTQTQRIRSIQNFLFLNREASLHFESNQVFLKERYILHLDLGNLNYHWHGSDGFSESGKVWWGTCFVANRKGKKGRGAVLRLSKAKIGA